MPKLHEIVALATGKKAEVEKAVTEGYHQLQKGDLFDGLQKSYRPAAEDGEPLPPEQKRAQLAVPEVIARACGHWSRLFDLTFTLDCGNQVAAADIVTPDGTVLVEKVPVPTLLFLEKQLESIKAFVSAIPSPDPTESWSLDPGLGVLVTPPVETFRTKKISRAIVLYPATTEHPAQTQLVQEDVIAGFWRTVKFTTRLPVSEKASILAKAGALLDAVKVARERANAAEVERKRMGDALVHFVFGPLANL